MIGTFKIKPLYIFLYFIFVFSVFVDLYNGYRRNLLSDSSSIIPFLYKGIMLVLCIIYSTNRKNWTYIYTRVILMCFIICLFLWIISHSCDNINEEINQIIKIIYGFFIYAFLVQHKDEIDIYKMLKILIVYGVIGAITIIIMNFFQIGISSYDIYTSGSQGFFNAGNDIGLVLIMTNCLCCFLYIKYKKITYIIFIFLLSWSMIILGTIACYLSLLLIIIAFLYSILKTNSLFFLRRVFLVLIVGIVSYYAVYNIMQNVRENQYFNDKVQTLMEDGNTRKGLVIDAKKVLSEYDFIDYIIGKGYTGFNKEVAIKRGIGSHNYRQVEVDQYDIFGAYGIIITLLLFYLPVVSLIDTIKLYVKTKDSLAFWLMLSVILFIYHSTTAGHGIVSPQVMTIFSGIAFLIYYHKYDSLDKLYIKKISNIA